MRRMTTTAQAILAFGLLLAGTPQWSAAGEATAGKDGFKIIDGTDFSLDMHFLAQLRFRFGKESLLFRGNLYDWINSRDIEFPENVNDTRTENQGSFRMRRVRTIFEGHAFKPWLHYRIEGELYGDKTRPRLLDGYVRLGNEKGFWADVGQFRPVFDTFNQVAAYKLHFAELPVGSDLAPSYDLGFRLGWQSKSERWVVQLAEQNGTGDNVPDNNDGKMFSLRAAMQSKGGISDDPTSSEHPDEVQYSVGVALLDNSVGTLVDDRNPHTPCLLGTSTKCSFDDTHNRAVELFAVVKAENIAAAVSFARYRYEDGRLVAEDGTTDDSELTAISGDIGWFAAEKLEVVGRFSSIKQDKPALTPPTYGPDTLTDPLFVPFGRNGLVDEKFRLRQVGVGVNYYWRAQNMKLHVSWSRTEEKTEIEDRYLNYVPDLNFGQPGIQLDDLVRREGRVFRRNPAFYALLSFFI